MEMPNRREEKMPEHTTHHGLVERAKLATKEAIHAVWRTPVEVALGLGLAACACIAVHDSGPGAWRVFGRIAAAVLPLFIAIFGVSILHAFGTISTRARHGLTVAYLVAGGIYGNMIFHPHYQSELWRWVLISGAVAVGFTLLPMAIVRQRGAVRDMLWTFNLRMIFHITASLGFLFALATGLVIGMLSLDELLGIDVPRSMPGYIYSVLMLGAGPWMIAAGLPSLLSERGVMTPAGRKLLGIVCTYLFTPLMMLYLVILYAYQGRVLLGGVEAAPKNLMSPLVIAASAMMIIGLLFTEQLKRGVETSLGIFVKLSQRLPLLFIPLMPMTAWAVWVRIEQHGWTEFRYLRLVLVVCLTVIFISSVALWLMKKSQPLGTIIATFGVAAILSAIGPWSAAEVSRKSQTARMINALEAAGLMMPNPHSEGAARIMKPLTHTGDEHLQITEDANSRIEYLAEHFGPDAFEAVVSPAVYRDLVESTNDGKTTLHSWHVREALGWGEVAVVPEWKRNNLTMYGHDPTPIPITGELYEFNVSRWSAEWHHHRAEQVNTKIKLEGDGLLVTTPQGQANVSLAKHRATLVSSLESLPMPDGGLKDVEMTEAERMLELRGPQGELRGVIVLERIELQREDRDKPFRWNSVHGVLILAK